MSETTKFQPTPNPAAYARPIGVLIGDPQPLFREAVARVVRQRVDLHLLEEVGDGRSALAAIRGRRPTVAVLDRDLPLLPGSDVAWAVTRDRLTTVVLLMAGRVRAEDAYQALGCGARGILAKTASGVEIGDAIARIAAGETVLGSAAQAGVAQEIRLRASDGRPALSRRERQVLEGIALGRTAPEIGRDLHLGTSTVKTHMLHLYEKLEVSERAAAVAQAMRRGLLE